MLTPWLTGVAEVVTSTGRTVTVRCPHCDKDHVHGKDVVGSRSVISGCHKGWTRCREYRVVDLRKRSREVRRQ